MPLPSAHCWAPRLQICWECFHGGVFFQARAVGAHPMPTLLASVPVTVGTLTELSAPLVPWAGGQRELFCVQWNVTETLSRK